MNFLLLKFIPLLALRTVANFNHYQDQLLLNAGQKYCRMIKEEHSAILSIFIKLPLVIKIFVVTICEWPFYTGFTVLPSEFRLTDEMWDFYFNDDILQDISLTVSNVIIS